MHKKPFVPAGLENRWSVVNGETTSNNAQIIRETFGRLKTIRGSGKLLHPSIPLHVRGTISLYEVVKWSLQTLFEEHKLTGKVCLLLLQSNLCLK